MSIFVDREIPVESNSIIVELCWHSRVPLLAIGAYSEELGGNVRLVDGSGSATEEADPIPPHSTAQVRNHLANFWLDPKYVLIPLPIARIYSGQYLGVIDN